MTFTELDLPKFGTSHNEPLFITIQLEERRLPRVLVDNGSGMNILPAKLLNLLDIKPADLKPSSLTIKAYDSTARSVLGSITLNLWFGKKSMPVEFQVIDIPITFNALLGRPWLHQANGVASSLHQCVKIMLDGTLTTIYGDLITSEGTETGGVPILEIKHDDDGYMLTGFTVEAPKVQVCAADLTTTKDKITPAMRMMRKMNYLPGLGLGRHLQGTHKIIRGERTR